MSLATDAIDIATEADQGQLQSRFAALPGATFRDDGLHQSLRTGLAGGLFNAVINVRWDDRARERVAALHREAVDAGTPWRFFVTGATTPAGLEAVLAQDGLVQGIPGKSMWLRDPSAVSIPDVSGLHIEPVVDDEGLERWLGVRAGIEGFSDHTTDAWRVAHRGLGYEGDAPVRSWIGLLDGEVVATVLLHIGDARPDGTRDGGIYHVVTAPQARRRGIATALTAHAVRAGAALGITRCVLSTTLLAEAAYARVGFETGGPFTYWYDPRLGT